MQIYLDHSATTPPRAEVLDVMQSAMTQQWGNPSSLHNWGNRAALLLERARMQVARLLNAPPETVVFTSGGTEANNLALLGVTRKYSQPRHLIISSVEHSAVSQPAAWLEAEGWRVTRLGVDRSGRVSPQALQAAIAPDTVLISVIYGQSEVGTLQPIHQLGRIAQAAGVLFHTDAVQVAGRLPLDLQTLPVDLLSLSSHKLYGPQGAGALYIRPGIELLPILGGGGQEGTLRSGTQAMPAIAGFGVAAELARLEITAEAERLANLRDLLFAHLLQLPGVVATGSRGDRLPHHVSICLHPLSDALSPEQLALLSGRNWVRQLNLAGIGISAGSACHSGQLSPSPSLQTMGYSNSSAMTSMRFTLGHSTTEADITWVGLAFRQIYERIVLEANASPVLAGLDPDLKSPAMMES
jgi:cysteine desulfurase